MLIECAGVKLKRGWVPPFSMSNGEHLNVGWTQPYSEWEQDCESLRAIVTGQSSNSALLVATPLILVQADKVVPDKSIASLLKEHGGRNRGLLLRDEYHIDINKKYCSLAATARILVQMEMARANNAPICYVAGGLDPLGFVVIKEFVEREFFGSSVLTILQPIRGWSDGPYDLTKMITIVA